MATLSDIKNQFAQNSLSNPKEKTPYALLTDNQRQTAMARYQYEQEQKEKNQGGFFGGIGYAFEKIGLGFLQSIEGIWDFAAGGLADLFGAHDWAEKQIANDWVNYQHADEWFNPSEGWQFVGDVAGGIGTSLPAIATVAAAAAITFFSGGTLSPVAAGLIGGVVAGFGAAGTATKEAYNETGELTGATWGYGALSGFTEGVMEGVTDAIGFGVGSITKNIAKSTAKEGAKTVGKQIAKSAARKTFGKVVLESFLSEAFEEGVQELIDPVWKRITYDPNAENATFQQVAYAALVGGLSGAIMGGADVSVRNSINYFSGSKINGKGGANGVISLAETIAQTEGVNQSGNAQVDFVVDTLTELQESLKKTNGEVKTAKQKMLVGILSKANTAAPLSIVVSQNADAIVHDAETTAQRLNDIGYKTSKGETVTAEMLKQGVTGERGTREYRKSLSMAMKTNEALRTVAVMSAAGQLNMDAAQFQQSTLRGEQLATQADLNHFVETATDAQKRDVGERLGITDWATVTADELKSRIVDFSTNGGLDQYISEREQVKKLSELEISKKGLPKYVGSITQDGAVRYKFGDASVAIVKNGDTYLVYDYANDVISKPLSKKEANRVIKEIYAASAVSETNADVQAATETTETAQQQTQSEKQAAELDAFAREHVPDYKKIVGAQQQAVRQTLRQARAAGVTEADQILYASVAARSGANIEFVSAETLGADADAGYSLKDGKILVNREIANNPKARTAAKILLHEFTHGMIHKGYAVKGKKGKKHLENRVLNDFFTTAIKGLSAEQQIEILTPYIERHGVKMQDFIDGKVDISLDTYIELREELAAHFVERELGNSAALQRIISDKPTFKDKLLSFLKKSKSDYAANEKLSRAANALLKKYQNFFNKYATQTRFSPTITNDLSVRKQSDATTETDTGTRHALREALGKLGEYNELRKRHIESREGDTVSRNYDDIMDFIKSSDRVSPVKRLHIGIVNDSTANMVKRKTGIDIQGYDFVLASNFIAHIFDSHGTTRTEAPRNQIPVTYKNIENIIETVIEPTDVTRVSDKNGVALKFTKDIDGKNVALTITSTKKSTLTLKSAWIIENSEGRTPSASAETLAGTPETNGRNLTTDSIAENSENVNRNGKKSGKKRYALAGENSRTSDNSMLERAKQLIADGIDSESVRQQTGWFIGYDGKWRYEIDDSAAVLVEKPKFETHFTQDGSYQTAKLGDVLQHESLYEAYPFLRDTLIILQETEFGTDGSAWAEDNQIVLDRKLFERTSKAYLKFLESKQAEIKRIEQSAAYKEYNRFFTDESLQETLSSEEWLEQEAAAQEKFYSSEIGKRYHEFMWGKTYINMREIGWSDRAKLVLLHEIQHLVQANEGFASGASTSYWYKRLLKEHTAAATSAHERFSKLYKQATPKLQYAMEQLENAAMSETSKRATIDRAYDNAVQYAQNESQEQVLWDFAEAYEELNDFKKNGRGYADSHYTDTAGEIEARDVSSRAELTAEQRREKRPDIDRKKVYFTETENAANRYALSESENTSRALTEEQYQFVSKLSMIDVTQTEDGRYSVYCENNSGLLEYEANNLTYERLVKYFGEELAADMTAKAKEIGKTTKILRDTLSAIVEKNKSLSNITPDIYKKAKRKFGITNNVQVAGYINLDGTMLDFSGGYDYRLHDHRDISEIMSDVSGTKAMNAYIAQGNIRLMPESPSIELDYQHEPTAKQYATIRKVVDTLLAKLDNYGRFFVEFSDAGSSVESREYGRNTPTSKIISDIQYFYKNGVLPQQSELSKFRYALTNKSTDGSVYTADVEVRYALSKETLDFLNNQDGVKVYRAMQLIDGELYPPMAAKVKSADGKKQLVTPSILGEWEQSVERPDLIKNGKFELNKGNGSTITAAYNPYFHTSLSPLNDQFSSAYKRDNLVVVEGIVPSSELTSGYKAQYAKDAVGETKWHSGVVSSKLKGEKARRVILSRWFKPVRIVSDAEVAGIIAKTLSGENIEIPYNVVTPQLRQALENEGVKIRYALNETAESRRNKSIAGQMDIFSDIIGVQDNTTQTAAWDSDYTKQAQSNAENIIKQLKERGYEDAISGAENDNGQGRGDTSNNGKRSGVLDFGAVRRLFEGTGKRTTAESRLYSRIVRELGGYSIKVPFANSIWRLGVVNEAFYTYDMLRVAETNTKNGVGTVFYLDDEMYRNGKRHNAADGLFFRGGSNVYVRALISNNGGTRIPLEMKRAATYSGKSSYFFDYLGAWGKDAKYAATRGENNQSRVTMRHERLHLVYDAASRNLSSFSQETYNAVRELKQFVEQRFAGKADIAHKSIKDYYVKELGYGKVETAIEEIACDLYCEDLILIDETERAEVQKLIDGIDKTLNDVVGKDGVRYALSDIESKYAEQTDVLFVHEKKDKISISNIVVKKELRNSGIGQAILTDIINYADENGKTITLTPTSEFGTKERLKQWYKRNGFVENKGRNTDFTISDSMYRLPRNADGSIRYALTNPDADTNSNPTESDNSGAIGGLTRGQRAKFVANNTKFKVYTKTEAASVIDSIIAERLTLRDGQFEGVLSGKNRAEVIERLFTKLNNTPEGYRLGVALNIADYIINNAVLTDMYETFNDDSYAMGVLSTLRSYMHRMDLSGIQSEIQHKFDKKNSINLVWGAKKDGMAPDVIAQELQELGIRIEAINEADQFFEMLDIYESAKEQVNRKAEKIMLTAIGSQSEIEHLRQEIARDVLTAYDEKGTPSKYAKLVEKYTKRIADLKRDLSTAYKRNTLINRIIDGAAYLRDVATKRNYVGADIFAAPELTAWLKQLSKIKYRSDMRKSGVRKILLDYGQFYNKQNTLLYDENPDLSYIDENVLDALDYIRQNALSNKPLSMEELQAAQVIIASAKHLFNTYDQILIDGKKQKISDLAAEGNEIIKKSKNRTNKGFFNRIYGVFNKIIEPRVVIKSLENFNPNGILTRAYNAVTNGETEAGLLYIELTNDIDTYLKKKKGYKKRLASEYITVAGHEMTVGEAISLYELSKRPQAQEGLYEAGFSYIDKKGSKRSVRITESDIAKLADTFTDADKGFIELVETFFNVASKQVKTDADMQILGYTNTSEEFYYPIKRDSGTIAKNITDARSIMADWANVYNFSFNKDVKTGAKNKLFITDVYSVITRHAKQLSTYAKMTVPLKNFSQIYAKNIGDKTNVVSIRNTINEQVWNGAESYLSKLFADIQGRATSSSFIEKMRGAYAKYQLGANLKVIVSQVTSYPTAGVLLDTGVMAKGFVMKTNWAAMDKYCPYARVRNYERGIVKAEGVVDKVGKVGDVLTKPIQWTDRFTIGRLWNACQLQVQKNTGLKYGTVENMTQAGVMLEEVIRLTQPNYTNTERSELMRSDSDIVRSFTMFTSVPLKQLSRLVESFGEYNALRSLIKSGDTDTTLSKRYKLAKKKLRRTLAAVTVANLMYVLVGQFFKFLYNQQAEDEKEGKVTAKSVLLDMLSDFGSTTIGMLPIVRDIYGYFVNGYEINSFTGDMLNSIIGSTKSLFELATKAASGEEIKTQDYMRIFRDSLYGIGQVTGIPVRNINNLITGLIRRFSPSAAYSYTSLFYNPTYSKDIKAALKKGDYDLAETVMGMMLKDGRTGGLNERATKKLIELYDAGYSVLPQSVGNEITYKGETIKLTSAQQSTFKSIYSQANGEIEKLVNSMEFATLPADKQAKAIKLLYDAYYSRAQASVLKLANENRIVLLSGAIQPNTLAAHLSAISAIESETDKTGTVVNGSKKAKVIKYVMAQKLTTAQKLLLILSLGYTIKDGDIRGVTAAKAKSTVAKYITTLSLTRAEKTALAEKCGLTVKNGRIYAA